MGITGGRSDWVEAGVSAPTQPSQLRDSVGITPSFPRFLQWLLTIGTGNCNLGASRAMALRTAGQAVARLDPRDGIRPSCTQTKGFLLR